MTIICTRCQIELRPKLNGFPVEAMRIDGPESLHDSDLWSCRSCGLEVATGLGTPIISHFQPNYEKTVGNFGPVLKFWRDADEKRRSLDMEREIR